MKPTRDLRPGRYAWLTMALGMSFMFGLANCGSNPNSGGTGGTGGNYCTCGGTPPNCWSTAGCPGHDTGGTGGGDTGGGSGTSGGGGSGGGGSGGSGRGGSGGSGGGGSGGSGGGGSGGSVGAAWAPPACLRDLFAACPTTGECHYAAGVGLEYCFASGTSADYVTSHSCGASNVTSDKVTVNKPDGSLCYTYEAVWHPSCESAQWSWKNAAGDVVATGSGYWVTPQAGVTCAAGGGSVTCSSGSCSIPALTGALGPFGPTTCTAGTCP